MLALPSAHCPIPLSPFWLFEGLEHLQTSLQLPNSGLNLSLLFPPDASLVRVTLALLLASAKLPFSLHPALDRIWHACEHWLLCSIQESSRQEELISSMGYSQQFPHLDQG